MPGIDTTLEQPALDAFYRVEKEWRLMACWTSCLGTAAAIWLDTRSPAVVLLACSVLCQAVSWRAMRAAQRLEKRRRARIDGEGNLNG